MSKGLCRKERMKKGLYSQKVIVIFKERIHLQYMIMYGRSGLLKMLCKTVGRCVSELLYPASFSPGYFSF